MLKMVRKAPSNLDVFRKLFPRLKDVQFTLTEHPYGKRWGDDSANVSLEFSMSSGKLPPKLYPCTDPLCNKGGFNMESIIREMYENLVDERNGVMLCTGKYAKAHCAQQAVYSAHLIYL